MAVPGITMYILIGRTQDYAWSLTSANHDVRDVFAEQLCNPDATPPTRESTHYVFEGKCRPFEMFDAGTLNGTPIRFPRSVHGPVIGTATVDGQPYALTRKRSTFGRDGLNLAALKDMTEGKADTSRRFFEAANQFEFTFNWAYASRSETAYFSSGLLPRRARGLDRRLPTLGTGEYEWRGFLRQREHPHDVGGPGGLLLNWNNQSAPGFMHGDGTPFGSAHRVELFDQWPRHPTLADTVSVMNRAATEDVRSPVWPVVSRVLRTGPAPSALADRTVDVLDDWVARDAPRLDADLDGDYDDAGPLILDRALATRRRGGHAACVRRPHRRSRRRPRSERRSWPVVRRQGPARAPRRPGQGSVQPQLLRQRLARRLPSVAMGGRRAGGRRARRRAGAGAIDLDGNRGTAPDSTPASSPIPSAPPTAPRSSRCWSWPARGALVADVARVTAPMRHVGTYTRRRAAAVLTALAILGVATGSAEASSAAQERCAGEGRCHRGFQGRTIRPRGLHR